jgi:hypothetical protein
VSALATDPEGELVVMLHGREGLPRCVLSGRARLPAGGYRPTQERPEEGLGPFWLSPVVNSEGAPLVAFCNGWVVQFFWDQSLLPYGDPVHDVPGASLAAVLLFPPPRGAWCGTLFFAGNEAVLRPGRGSAGSCRAPLGWTPQAPSEVNLPAPPLSWLRRDPEHLELAGLLVDGTICWTLLQSRAGLHNRGTCLSRGERYLAAALVGPGLVAGVTADHVDWLRAYVGGFRATGRTPVAIPAAVACFACHETHELIVVCRDGFVVRVPAPA